jgi:ligand-binding sensor domain-containing protein
MPSQRAYAAARTNDGTIWVGTSTGLLKLKGGQWTLMERSTTGAPGEVNNLFAAPDGTLWLSSYPIGTGRLCQFDPVQEKCIFTHEYSRDGVAAFELIGENPDLIFYGTRQGLYLLKSGDEKAELWSIGDDGKMLTNSVSSITLDSNNQMWVGTTGGMMVVDPADPQTAWTSYRAERDTPNVPGGNWASALTPVENGGMWAVITNGQLSYFDGAGKWTVFQGSEYYSARMVGIDPQGRAWIVKDDQPVRVFESGEQVAEYTTADGLPEGRLTVLFNDGDSLWIGGNGLSGFKDGKIETIFGKDDFSGVIAIARDVDGSLLVARSNSLIRLDGNNIPTVMLKGEYGDDILDVTPESIAWQSTQLA